MEGCDESFESTNYGVMTTPRKEYEISTGARKCPEKDMLDRMGRRVRIVKPTGELMELKAARRAGLIEQEILAVVCRISIAFSLFLILLPMNLIRSSSFAE